MATGGKSHQSGLFSMENLRLGAINRLLSSFSEHRGALNLTNPGTVEDVGREVQRGVFLNNSMFAGLRADITKTFSATPMFQTSHAFSMGSQGIPPYTFLSSYGTSKIFLHGTIDNEGQLAARANYRWSDAWVTRTQTQVAPSASQPMVQVDNDYTGKDFSASIKTLNPSLLDGGLTGIIIATYLQSVTRGLALGLEAIWQRQAISAGPDTALSYVVKYRGADWTASAQLQAQGAVTTTYWRKLTDKVEAGAELNLQFQPGVAARGGAMGGMMRREGVATVGAKYDFRASTFRAQVDSSWRLSALLEKRVLPFVQLTFAGELDHAKQQAKVGVGVSVEAPNDEVIEQQERAIQANTLPPPY